MSQDPQTTDTIATVAPGPLVASWSPSHLVFLQLPFFQKQKANPLPNLPTHQACAHLLHNVLCDLHAPPAPGSENSNSVQPPGNSLTPPPNTPSKSPLPQNRLHLPTHIPELWLGPLPGPGKFPGNLSPVLTSSAPRLERALGGSLPSIAHHPA